MKCAINGAAKSAGNNYRVAVLFNPFTIQKDQKMLSENEPAARDWCFGMSYAQHPNH